MLEQAPPHQFATITFAIPSVIPEITPFKKMHKHVCYFFKTILAYLSLNTFSLKKNEQFIQ